MIPVDHARTLSTLCSGPTCLVVSDTMDHNTFDFDSEFMEPLIEFLLQHDIEGSLPGHQQKMDKGFMFSRPYFSYVNTPTLPVEDEKVHISHKSSHIIPQRETIFGDEIIDDQVSTSSSTSKKGKSSLL